MSVQGEHAAVVSVGVSCQAAIQIRKHAGLLSELLGEALTPARFPFDWIIAPAASASRFVLNRLPLPASSKHLEPVGGRGAETFAWYPQGGFHLIHDFHSSDGRSLDLEGAFAATVERYARARERFMELARRRTRYFVLANTQNNLEYTSASPVRFDIGFDLPDLAAMQSALDHLFPGENRLIVVTYRHRATEAARQSSWAPVILEPDRSEWDGDEAAWGELFRTQMRRP